MPTHHAIAALSTLALLSVDVVLASDSRDPPKEFRIFRSGTNETTKGVFVFDEESQKSVIAGFTRHGADVPIDYEHKMLDWLAPAGDMVAAGWFTPEVRSGDLWASNVRWTTKAASHLREGEWRYMSPAFTTGEDGRILELINVALTNLPATHQLEALVAATARALSEKPPPASAGKETPMRSVLIALGLSENSTEADAVGVVGRAKEAATQDKSTVTQIMSIVGAASASEAIGKVAGLRDEAAKTATLSARVVELESGLRRKEVEAIVGEKVTAGFLTPANRDFAITLGMESPKSFDAYLATLTAAPMDTSGGKDKPAAASSATTRKLSKDESSIAATFGMKPQQFADVCLSNKADEVTIGGASGEEEVALWPQLQSSEKPRRWARCGSSTSMIFPSPLRPRSWPAPSSSSPRLATRRLV